MQKAYKPLQEQADAATKTLHISQRPWLAPQLSLASDLHLKNSDNNLTIKFSVKNFGNAAATDVKVTYATTVFELGHPNPKERENTKLSCSRDVSEIEELLRNAGSLEGTAVFPGETIEDTFQFTFPEPDVSYARA
ncbi:hypothetical protein [Rhodopseudomonas parapalustris]